MSYIVSSNNNSYDLDNVEDSYVYLVRQEGGVRLGVFAQCALNTVWHGIKLLQVEEAEMLEALEGAKWLIESYVSDLEHIWEYRAVCEAIKKARGEE